MVIVPKTDDCEGTDQLKAAQSLSIMNAAQPWDDAVVVNVQFDYGSACASRGCARMGIR